jgi:uncharacterized protein YndB with AHSA1/START domain
VFFTGDSITVQRLIPATPERIFDLLADPARHVEIDGSGTVRQSRGGSRRLGLGDTFGMNMRLGVGYATLNKVVELEESRRIAWQTLAGGPLARVVTGRTWRYELAPQEGGTLVKETWDISTERFTSRPFVRLMATSTRQNMEKTLERIEQALAAQT